VLSSLKEYTDTPRRRRKASMMEDYFARMIRLAEEVFHATDDPSQLAVDDVIIARLGNIHPATMQAEQVEAGPVAWTIVIPTTDAVMRDFLAGIIGERELLDRTPVPGSYDAVYLCSALVLPEFRRQGIATRLIVEAVRAIREDHPVRILFAWGFSDEGRRVAMHAAGQLGLPCLFR
jgi:GNAT superfamily N-acetyltransferase